VPLAKILDLKAAPEEVSRRALSQIDDDLTPRASGLVECARTSGQSETPVEHTLLPRVARTVIVSRPDRSVIRFSTENDPLGATVVAWPLHTTTPLSTRRLIHGGSN